MNNPQIAEIFENIAGLLEMKGESVFTIRAYQRVARTIDHLPTELAQMVREERESRKSAILFSERMKRDRESITADNSDHEP